MNGLMLHCGAGEATRDEVRSVPVPDSTDTFTPIPHHMLLEEVENTLTTAGMHIVNENHGLTAHGKRWFATLEVRNGHSDNDYGLIVGCRNSHDHEFAASLVLGSRVFVCDNLSFSGEVKLARKHTRFIVRDLPNLVARAVGRLGDQRNLQAKRFEAYRNTPMSHDQACRFILDSTKSRAITPSKVLEVFEEWNKPRHEEFEDRNLWSLFNSFTEVYKQQQPALTLRRSQALHGMADAECGLSLALAG